MGCRVRPQTRGRIKGATWKTLYDVKFGSMSFRSAISINILVILMGEFDTQLSTSSSGVEITKENKVVFGCQL